MEEFTSQRDEMVRNQIEERGIRDVRVLQALRKVRRHEFVPWAYRHQAYEDMALPYEHGQAISQPYIVALMTELLALKGDEKVLEIGTGSGYQTAVLAELAREVYSVEIIPTLADRAQQFLKELGYRNVHVLCADGFSGWVDQSPFDAIIVTCAPEETPPALIQQLVPGGRLVIPVGRPWQELVLLRVENGKIVTTNITAVQFVPMVRDAEEEDNQRREW